MATIDAVLNTIDANLPASTQRLFDLLSIPSVSTDPAYTQHCQRAANWLADQLKGLGYTADVRETPGHPIVVGHAKAKRKDAPHVLFYGHYDVQPADPLGLWETDPFAPRLAAGKDGDEIVARGASDDKGQLMTFVEACRAFEANGGLPCNVTFLFEGEEETGSPSLPGFLAANKDELSRPDIALVCDTSMWNATTPAITVMLRGLAQEEVFIRIASHDLHSGMFGGPVNNPVHVLAKIIADLHDEEGKVTLPGFYAGVPEIPEDIAEQWRALDFDEAKWLGEIGLTRIGGETGRGILEQIWARPTCDVNGVVGGYTGKGSKTVLPAEASAKFSFRLVGKQDAKAVLESFRAFVKERLPADAKVEFINHGASNALQLPFGSEALNRARRALSEEWGKEAALAGCGGSIPIVGAFKRDLNMDALMIGFALDDDRIHSPNEKYSYTSFHKGARSWARVLDALAS
ncbi:M20/M25/M40 family metallo-hydrolase [Methylocystis sp. Sn-Cys]|uniref:M20/M25/M40 family metallo-hydrolase n=1 Tax=Methylocystis sp. Sn-Cys TaxID=1701263 RepID=UPI001921F342|nr:M20/M25/M40 family metallo-hydrolase [Methylocystis sp. Sn-Cys]MBL1255511.1 M20/M25/M40 family metallo-hydrolase [Methylocystis sp. Sn-Cys]